MSHHPPHHVPDVWHTGVMAENRVQMRIRVSPELRQQIADYANAVGITSSAAAAVLIAKGLNTETHHSNGPGAGVHSPDLDQKPLGGS